MKQKNTLGYVIFMAVVAAIGGILFGYDTAVISGTTAIVKNQFALTDMLEGWYYDDELMEAIGDIVGKSNALVGKEKSSNSEIEYTFTKIKDLLN